jgi:hypothetical protein
LLGEGNDAVRVGAFDETFFLLAAILLPAMIAGWFMEPKKSAVRPAG